MASCGSIHMTWSSSYNIESMYKIRANDEAGARQRTDVGRLGGQGHAQLSAMMQGRDVSR